MSTDISSARARFERGSQAFTAAVNSIPAGELDHPPAADEWTPRQLILHIVDAEIVGAARLRWVAAQPGCALKSYAGDIWAQELRYQSQPLDDAVQLFVLLRRTTLAMLRNLPEESWTHRGVHEESGEMTLEKLLNDHCEHAEAHIRELEERLPHVTSIAV